VPAVMHGIETVKRTIKNEKGILGVELEVSTFYHFTQKSNMRSYALLYVSDNEKHGILSGTKNSRQASHRALRKITKIAFEVLK
jgi:purine-nucleoside phosphorylase